MQRSSGSAALLYRLTAPHYEAAIAPVMQPFAEALARDIPLRRTDALLDVGTGTGLLLRAAAGRAALNIGVDVSMPMLRVGQSLLRSGSFPRSYLLQMDANTLGGLADNSVTVAAASFGLSDGEPEAVFGALARVLPAGGRLVFQEWGPYDTDDPRLLVDETLALFDDAAVPGPYDDFLADLVLPRPWEQQLQDVEDYTECLTVAGFQAIRVQESRPVQVALSVEDFLAYLLAWPPRKLVLRTFDEVGRQTFMRQITGQLQLRCEANGLLCWSPVLFRASAVRKI